jgi:predicted glycoside hydrolase/deacetylase ChbG (UPF0249 family)
MNASAGGSYLIVNADDYGYFRCVSDGILELAARGIVRATGVFANAPLFKEYSARLRDCPALDVGNHLNLTYGVPLTSDLRRELARWSGRLPGKAALVMALASGAIGTEAVRAEWRAQIDRCLGCGLRVRFLNSHEHVHMLPPLFSVAVDLAREYGIDHLRFASSRVAWHPPAALFRSTVLKCLGVATRARLARPAVDFVGLDASGKLDLTYLRRLIVRFRAGELHELMCHPGRFDANEMTDHDLLRYHDWEGERRALLDPAFGDLLLDHGVTLVGYRNLEVMDGQLAVRVDGLGARV